MSDATPDENPSAALPPAPPEPPAPAFPAAPAPAPRAERGLTEWWSQPAARWAALLAATAAILYLCWQMVAPFTDVIMWAVVLVVCFYPVHRRIAVRFRSPGLAAAASCLLVIVTILIPLALVSLAIVRDAKGMADSLQAHRSDFLDPAPDSKLGRAFDWLGQYVDVDQLRSREYVVERARSMGSAIAAGTFNVLGGALGVLVQVFFVIFTMYYLFRDGPRLRTALRDVLPLDRWQAHEVFLRTKDVIVASVYGSLVIAAVQGVLGGLALWVLGVPSPLLWGVVMILLCMIPMAGAFVVWVPAAIYLLATGHWVKAILLTLWGAGVIGTIDNVLRPKLVGERTRLHELVVFFAVLGGIQVFGILGIVTGPAVAAIAIALLDVWRQARVPAR